MFSLWITCTNKIDDLQVLTREDEEDVPVDGLWAAGEAACASVHGANRLGANSLLEIIVFGRAVADNIEQLTPPGETHDELSPVNLLSVTTTAKPFWKLLNNSYPWSVRFTIVQQIGQETVCRFDATRYAKGSVPVAVLREEMQRTMQNYCGVFRTCYILQRGCREMTRLYTCELPNICVS